ncbi:hypothetical protein ACFLTH_15575 [Bacteroidota bacterium]
MAEQDFQNSGQQSQIDNIQMSQQTQQSKEDPKDATPFETISQSVTGIGSRLRVLEERYMNLRKKNQMTDENLLNFEKDIRDEIHTINQDLLEIKKGIFNINENLSSISEELRTSVKQSDLKTVEKYVDMWQPMNFVTKEELDRRCKDK